MKLPTISMEEAIIAASLERISEKVNGRPWLDVLLEQRRDGSDESSDEIRKVYSELAHEIKEYVGDKAAVNFDSSSVTVN